MLEAGVCLNLIQIDMCKLSFNACVPADMMVQSNIKYRSVRVILHINQEVWQIKDLTFIEYKLFNILH